MGEAWWAALRWGRERGALAAAKNGSERRGVFDRGPCAATQAIDAR